MKENRDLVEFVQACWNTDIKEAERVTFLFLHIFGTDAAEKHIRMNGPVCSIAEISPDDYLELCKEIERIVVTGNKSSTYFISGIRDLMLAKCT